MDSGNSGSLQSSSGGDEEYDSRAADSIIMSAHPPLYSNPPPPLPLFDPLSNFMQLHQNPILVNPSCPGPASIRSDPNLSKTHETINHMLPIPSFQTPPAAAGEDNNQVAVAPSPLRNTKKRTRASRRAPTTVLTTDTSNFRAMVQEFTGIPAAPFKNSSFPRSRLDLFGTVAQQPAPCLRRPYDQKVQSPRPFIVSSTAIDAIAASSTANNYISSLSSTPITQGSGLFNIQNPIFTSLLQSNPKFIFSNSSFLASEPDDHQSFEIPSNSIKIGGLDESGLSDGNISTTLSGLPNLISPDQIVGQNNRNDNNYGNNSESWRNNGVSPDDYDSQARSKRINGGYSFLTNGKMNYPASSSSFHGQKGSENIATRGEGMVESWICSSE